MIYLKFIFLPALTALLTWYCYTQNLFLDMKIIASVFFAGIFFAFAITLGTANKRRFEAFDEIASLKSHLLSLLKIFKIHFAHKDFERNQKAFQDFFPLLKKMLTKQDYLVDEAVLKKVDLFFSALMEDIHLLKKTGLDAPEVSRLIHWHQEMYRSFEKLISIKEYNTPMILRYFTHTALITSVFILAPEFASMGYVGVIGSALVSLTIITLMHIQDMIEDPFGKDLDDIHFEFMNRMKKRLKNISS